MNNFKQYTLVPELDLKSYINQNDFDQLLDDGDIVIPNNPNLFKKILISTDIYNKLIKLNKKSLSSYYVIHRYSGIDYITAHALVDEIGVIRSVKRKDLQIISVYPRSFNTLDEAKKFMKSILVNDSNDIPINTTGKLDSFCKDFLKLQYKFKWIIKRHFGDDVVTELTRLAILNESSILYQKLDSIYWDLPDHIYNIKENPDGFSELLYLVDNDYYKSGNYK